MIVERFIIMMLGRTTSRPTLKLELQLDFCAISSGSRDQTRGRMSFQRRKRHPPMVLTIGNVMDLLKILEEVEHRAGKLRWKWTSFSGVFPCFFLLSLRGGATMAISSIFFAGVVEIRRLYVLVV